MSGATVEILDYIESSKEDLADLMLRLGNTYGPFGHEAATAGEVHAWYGENGMESDYVEIIEDRACVVGNYHVRTLWRRQQREQRLRPRAWLGHQ